MNDEHEIAKTWATLKLAVVFAPKTGVLRPWEIHATFTYPHKRVVHWGSFKTEEAAKAKLAKLLKKYPQGA